MLVRREAEGALVIGQLSHAWLSGQLARAWGNDDFPAPEPREPLALGAEQHDVGWALFDLRPGLSLDSGLPRSFLELSAAEHLEIWRPAPDRLLSVSAYAALVVSLHGASLSELRLQSAQDHVEELRRHVEDERARQHALRGSLGLDESETARIQRQMWTWDGLSLALCNDWDPFTAHDVPARAGLVDVELRRGADGTLSLEPWPFASSRQTVGCEARRLNGRYDSDAAMQQALDEAPPFPLVFTLARQGE
jgi:hypothetical protein